MVSGAHVGRRIVILVALLLATVDVGGCAGSVGETTGASRCTGDIGTSFEGPPPCGTQRPEELMRCVEKERFAEDVLFVGRERYNDRAHWAAVQDRCAERFADYGFEVERHAYGTGVNVIGVKRGEALPNEQLLVSAHYDHIPGCEGADDNATGIAGVLEVARVLSTARFARTLVVACWDEEELGLIGSAAYAARARVSGQTIAAALVFEGIGYASGEPNTQEIPSGMEIVFPSQVAEVELNDRRGDFVLIINDTYAGTTAQRLVAMAKVASVPTIRAELTPTQTKSSLFYQLRRSDHAAFWDVDTSAIYIGDTGQFRNTHYHCEEGADVPDRLNYDFGVKIVMATVGAVAYELDLR